MNYIRLVILIFLLFSPVVLIAQVDFNTSLRDIEQHQELNGEHWPDHRRTDSNMSILFREIYGLEVVEGSEMACFTPEGVFGGVVRLDPDSEIGWGLAAWGDDSFTDEVEGFEDGEEVLLRYWDPVHHWELNMSVEFFQGNELTFHNLALIVVEATLRIKDKEPNLSPQQFQLERIFPNPFNSNAQIEFTLHKPAYVILNIYDISGRKVRTLLGEFLKSGYHHFILDGEGLHNGLYLVSIEIEGQKQVERVVLIK
ncbi:MAG: T9SS type A sorting domain-containing protein [Candidatus Hatepunaea meridiana]|nr:T9SS type A sorting domain-containing protein [Candidatus Hatepunaea meridiana]